MSSAEASCRPSPLRREPDLNAAADRVGCVWHAARLYHAGKVQHLLLSGGTTRAGTEPEAASMQRFLLALGVPPSAILLEERSLNTTTNASESAALLRARGARPDQNPDGGARDRCCQRSCVALAHVVRLHYIVAMKTAVIPQVRVEPELRADLDSVLLPGETLTEFVEASVRRAVEYRRVQTDFAARCEASLAAYERTGISIPSDAVLTKLEAKVAARVKQLRK